MKTYFHELLQIPVHQHKNPRVNNGKILLFLLLVKILDSLETSDTRNDKFGIDLSNRWKNDVYIRYKIQRDRPAPATCLE